MKGLAADAMFVGRVLSVAVLVGLVLAVVASPLLVLARILLG